MTKKQIAQLVKEWLEQSPYTTKPFIRDLSEPILDFVAFLEERCELVSKS